MLLPLIAVSTGAAATLNVGSDEGPYLTIGEAIAAASDGDVIRVAPGTYPEAIDLGGKVVALESMEGPATTIITGNGTVTLNASSGEPSAAVVTGFTLQGTGHTCVTLNAVSLQIRDSIITDCGGASTFLGGAVQINGGAPLFGNVVFSGNEAVNGGAIRSAFDADIQIEECRFEDNRAAAGGALHLTDSTLTVTDSEFTGNAASDADGGAIWGNEITLNLSTTDLVDNTARFNGGALFVTESTVQVDAMDTITGNHATYGAGGAMRIEGAEAFELSNSTFTGNRALTLGGAVSVHETESATISGSEFEGNLVNFSGGGGGALSGRDSVVIVSTSTFSENLSEGHGGALYAVDSQMELSGVELHTNEATGEGGAWYQLGGWSSCSSCELSRNTSTDDGGAIWSTAEDLALTESDVTWNETSGGNGGGVFFGGDRLLIEDVMFARNSGLSGGAVFAGSQEVFRSEFTVYQENESIFSGGGLWTAGAPDAVVVVQNNDLLANECLAADGVAQLMIAIDGADVRNNLVAFGRTGAGIGTGSDIGGTLLAYNDVYENEGGNYQGVADPTGEDGNLSVDPLLVDLSIDRNFINDNLYRQVESPLVEAGDPEIMTEDGRRSFIGAFNRLDLEDTDGDGDGFTVILGEDCDDAESTTYPGAPERCDDDVDNDCDGEVNESCDDTGLADTGRADTGSHHYDTGTVDTGLVEEPDNSDPDDRTPPADTPDDELDESAYKVSGEGCSCSVSDTHRRTGVWWLLTPLLIWVRRR